MSEEIELHDVGVVRVGGWFREPGQVPLAVLKGYKASCRTCGWEHDILRETFQDGQADALGHNGGELRTEPRRRPKLKQTEEMFPGVRGKRRNR